MFNFYLGRILCTNNEFSQFDLHLEIVILFDRV